MIRLSRFPTAHVCFVVLALQTVPGYAQSSSCKAAIPEFNNIIGAQSAAAFASAERPGGGANLQVNWNSAAGPTGHRVRSPRIAAGSVVDLHVHHFNFLRFTLQYSVEQDTIASYQGLEKLWTQLFALGGILASVPDSLDRFDDAMYRWMVETSTADKNLGNFLNDYRAVGLTDDNLHAICSQVGETGDDIAEIEKARQVALQEMNRLRNGKVAAFQLFQVQAQQSDQVVDRLRRFISAGSKTVLGEHKTLPSRASGTIVTVTMSAMDENRSQHGASARIEYPVQSRMPLTFHTGLAWSRIRDVEFEKVRDQNGEDAWAQVKNAETSTDLTAFLTYPLPQLTRNVHITGVGETYLSVGPTIGTEIRAPGTTIFAGATLNGFGRLFATIGVASAEVTEGGDAFVDRIGDELESRELFDTITRRREWQPYVAVSFSVF